MITGRVKGYIVILTLLIAGFITLIVTRDVLEGTVTRFPGMTYQLRDDGMVSNLYQITLINKTFEPQKVSLEPLAEGMSLELLGDQEWILEPQAKFEGRFFLLRDQDNVATSQEKVKIALLHEDEEIDKISTSFMAPMSNK